ncbi:MAG: LapA family protein [Acidimicrobiia bacterium]
MSDSRDREIVTGGSGINGRLVLGVLIVVAVLLFVFQNTQETGFRFLWLDFDLPLWIYTVAIFVAGALVGWATHMRRAKRKT